MKDWLVKKVSSWEREINWSSVKSRVTNNAQSARLD